MAASASPSVGGQSNTTNGDNDCVAAPENVSGGGGLLATDNSVVGPSPEGLRHNVTLAVDWSPEEQSTLEEMLAKYASETPVIRYALIANALNDKTVRDVAMRCRWMNKKEIGKRRKDENFLSKKTKDKKEKVPDSVLRPSQVLKRNEVPPYVQSVVSMDKDDGISFEAIGGTAGQLLEQTSHALDQISSNFNVGKIHVNVDLFRQARSNILSIMNDLNEPPSVMKHMPPLPVKLNEELARSVLPQMPPPSIS